MFLTQSDSGGGGQMTLGKDNSHVITNDGTICIVNNIFRQSVIMLGSGCINVGEGSSLTNSKNTGGIKNTPIVRGLQYGGTITFPFSPSYVGYNETTGMLFVTGLIAGQSQEVDVGVELKSYDFKITFLLSSTATFLVNLPQGPVSAHHVVISWM